MSQQPVLGKSYRARRSFLLGAREHPPCTPFAKGCEKVAKQFLETACALAFWIFFFFFLSLEYLL